MNKTGQNTIRPVSLYLHFPFCERKCRYCDFLSGPASEETRARYVEALCREISGRAGEVFVLDTIFLGGGTPSLLTARQLEQILEAVRTNFKVLPDAEISMEVNPGTADVQKLRAYRELGVNRLSIGVQSFREEELRLLGRIHTAEQAEKVVREARQAGFDNLNLDLMSALPGQTLREWKQNLAKAAALGPEHISAYSLILEEGTPLYAAYKRGTLPPLPGEEEDRAMYHCTEEDLSKYGYFRYEISNYARSGRECRHNCGYWTGHEYLGLGLGASSLLCGERFHEPGDMQEYLSEIDRGGWGRLRRDREVLTLQDRMEEFMFLGLRMTAGVSDVEFEARFGATIREIYGEVLRRHMAQGVIEWHDGRIMLTKYGLDVANYVMADYILTAETDL